MDRLVKVRPDGSGTIEETFMMSKEAVEMMAGMAGTMGAEQPKKEAFQVFDEAKLKKKAANKGQGVTYVSGQKLVTDRFEGYKAVYAFTDINKLGLNQNPSENMPSNPSGGPEKQAPKEYITFQFTKGSPATLIVRTPEEKPDKKAAEEAKPPEMSSEDKQKAEMVMAQMKQMFDGMKYVIAIEVAGDIVKTNATYLSGSRITMVEADFDKLLENPDKVLKLSQLKPETLEEAKKFMKDLLAYRTDSDR